MRVITWNRSFKGLSADNGVDDFDSEEHETHATVLDKMLAWEKKLYDEVKVCTSIFLFNVSHILDGSLEIFFLYCSSFVILRNKDMLNSLKREYLLVFIFLLFIVCLVWWLNL